jgi:hypothetical protein
VKSKELEKLIFELEHKMWESASNRNVVAFKSLVDDNAVMICGGYRCLGAEYAEFIKDFYINTYKIKSEEVIFLSDDAVQIHYTIDIDTMLPEAVDLAGTFHVVSLWKRVNNLWKLYFNMDSRIIVNN